MPKVPKININWYKLITKIISALSEINITKKNYSIFIDEIKSNVNNTLQIEKFSIDLKKAFIKNNIFNVISKKKIDYAKKKLKLSKTDQLKFSDKTMGLARYLKAQYVLCIEIKKETDISIFLKMRLILVNTGEIIWHYFDVT